jgi:AbrB family looped-hinge helix DNA binding protein
MSVTRKGQVTIPWVVREKLDIQYGDKVEFVFDEYGQVFLKPIKTDLDKLYGVLKDKKPTGSHEEHRREINEWVAESKGRTE